MPRTTFIMFYFVSSSSYKSMHQLAISKTKIGVISVLQWSFQMEKAGKCVFEDMRQDSGCCDYSTASGIYA